MKGVARLPEVCARRLKNVFQKSLNRYSMESLSFCALGVFEGQISSKILVIGVRLTGHHHSMAHEVFMIVSSARASSVAKMSQV